MKPKIRVFAKAGVEAVYGGGYDKDQMFYEISEIDFYNKTVTVWGCHRKDCGMCDDTYKIEDVEVLMSTGLKDKNGVEIYEGDIVHWMTEFISPIDMRTKHKIDSNEEVHRKESGEWGIGEVGNTLSEELLDVEVIGNIYKNPELLEAAE